MVVRDWNGVNEFSLIFEMQDLRFSTEDDFPSVYHPSVTSVDSCKFPIFAVDLSVICTEFRLIFYFVVFESIWSAYDDGSLVVGTKSALKVERISNRTIDSDCD